MVESAQNSKKPLLTEHFYVSPEHNVFKTNSYSKGIQKICRVAWDVAIPAGTSISKLPTSELIIKKHLT